MKAKNIRKSTGFYFPKGILIADFYNEIGQYKGTYPADKDFETHVFEKEYNIMQNIGSAKYVVNYHDGIDTHKDGSKFFNIAIFRNLKKLNKFEKELVKNGYIKK